MKKDNKREVEEIAESIESRNRSILGEETQFGISIKALIALAAIIASAVGMYYNLNAEIQEAKLLPEPNVSRTEYDLKDQLVRESILNTQKDVSDIKKQLDKIEDRLFESQRR